MSAIVNWRDVLPVVSHDNAIVWSCLQRRSSEGGFVDHRAKAEVLEKLGGLTVHAIQGRKESDHHKHTDREQIYYIIDGSGEVICGDDRAPIEEGDAIYLPSGPQHQIFNASETWLLHHVINMPVEGDGGHFLIRNWRDVPPESDGVGAVRWHLLGKEGEPHIGCLRGLAAVDREMLQPRGRSKERSTAGSEEVYYVLEGEGTITANGQELGIREGDAVHLLTETAYLLNNPGEMWLIYLVIVVH